MVRVFRHYGFAFTVLGAAALVAACGSGTTATTCTVQVSPAPGLFATPITFIADVTDQDGRTVASRIARTSVSLEQAPGQVPAQPEAIEPPAIAQPNPGPTFLAQGFHLVAVEDPCSGQWTRYAYLIDQTPPTLLLGIASGSFREPLTPTFLLDDEKATLLTRVYTANQTPPNFVATTAPIALTTSGTWIVDAFARDVVGNRSATATASYALFLSEAAIVDANLATPLANASRLPRLDLVLDRDMDTSQTFLPGALYSQSGAFVPIDLNLFWQTNRTVATYPAQRLPRGQLVTLDVSGLRTQAGGGLYPKGSIAPVTTMTVCTTSCTEARRFTVALEQDTIAAGTPDIVLTLTADAPVEGVWPLLEVGAASATGATLLRSDSSPELAIDDAPSGLVRTATFPAALLPTGRNTTIHVAVQGKLLTELGAARPATAGDPLPATVPTIVAASPADGTAAFAAIDLVASVPLDTQSVRDHAIMTVNGAPATFNARHLPVPFTRALRVTPVPALQAGDQAVLSLPTTVTDLWGRPLSTAFTTPTLTVAAPSTAALTAEWGITDGAVIDINTTADITALYLSPPVTFVASVVLLDNETGHELDMLAFDLSTPEGRAGVAHAESTLTIRRETWAPTLPLDRTYTLRVRGIVGADGSASLPLERSFTAAASGSPRRPTNLPTGAGFAVTRNDGHLLGPLNVTFATTTNIESISAAAGFAGGTRTLTATTPALYNNFVASVVPTLAAAASTTTVDAALGAWAGADTLTFNAGTQTWSHAIFALSGDHVPQPLAPADATTVATTITDITFAWAATSDSDIDAWLLLLFVDTPEAATPVRVFAAPRTARQITILRDEIGTFAFDLPLRWSIWGVRTGGTPQPPIFGLPSAVEWAQWRGAAISRERRLVLTGTP